MIERAYLLIEIISLLIGLFIVHVNKRKPTIVTIAYIAVSLIAASMIEEGLLSESFTYLIYFGLIAVSLFEYQDRIYDACIYAIMTIVLAAIIQLVAAGIVVWAAHTDSLTKVHILTIQTATCLILIMLGKLINLSKYIEIIFINGVLGKFVLAIAALISFYIFGTLKKGKVYEWKDVIGIPILIMLFAAILFQWQKERYLNKQKEMELLAYQKYNSIYKDLISEVRRRQHDFNNHLDAIFSMNMMAESLDQLVRKQNEYCSKMLIESGKNKLLNDNISSVFAGFLYTKIGQAEDRGIEVRPKIVISDIEEHISFVDMVEILGNLFDNAMEATAENECKIIEFSIVQKEDEVRIAISNPCDKKVTDQIEYMFREGNSSKGKGRGLGLSNVMRAIDRYHGEIKANSTERDGISFIAFHVALKI